MILFSEIDEPILYVNVPISFSSVKFSAAREWDFSMLYQIFLSQQVKLCGDDVQLLLINMVYKSCLTSCLTSRRTT